MREALTIARCCMMLGIFDLPRSLLVMSAAKHILCCILKLNKKLYCIHISATFYRSCSLRCAMFSSWRLMCMICMNVSVKQ